MKTKRVRAACFINAKGEYVIYGADDETDESMEGFLDYHFCVRDDCSVLHWIECDVPIPEPQTIEGKVVA